MTCPSNRGPQEDANMPFNDKRDHITPSTAGVRLPSLVDVNWVADVVGCSTRTIRRLNDLGWMPRQLKVGRLSRWREDEITAWINDGCKKVRSSPRVRR